MLFNTNALPPPAKSIPGGSTTRRKTSAARGTRGGESEPVKFKASAASHRPSKPETNSHVATPPTDSNSVKRSVQLFLGATAICILTYSGSQSSSVWNIPSLRIPRLNDIVSAFTPASISSRPKFVYEHPFDASSYYKSTKSSTALKVTQKLHDKVKVDRRRKLEEEKKKIRLAVVRPFCAFDAETLPETFHSWDSFAPCKAAAEAMGDEDLFGDIDQDEANIMSHSSVDLFLFYSQSYADSDQAVEAVDKIIDDFHQPGGWSQCFKNVYAIEAKIPTDLDLYIPSAQDELFNWVNGPNRQFEAAFRIIQSGEWGSYDSFYLMEGDSIPVKSFWLDMVISTIIANSPFAILGAKYNGDKWDPFYKQIPLSLIHHINGNAIYNTSHPFLDLLVGQLEVEAPSPYNSFPYDYRMSQIVVEGALGTVPEIAPKILLDEDGDKIALSNNTEMFTRWWNTYKDETPFKETPVINNYAATNIIPRHIGPEYLIHGAKFYSQWDPTMISMTLVISEWYHNRSNHLLTQIDSSDHPFSETILMVPPDVATPSDHNMTSMKVTPQHRSAPDFMDLCEADVSTDWFMMTNSYHQVAAHVDRMFTLTSFKPVIPFTPATYPFCFKFRYCKETVTLAQQFNPGHDKVVEDFDMVYNTKLRDQFCEEWKKRYGSEGENLYTGDNRRSMLQKTPIGPKGPTGTSYAAFLFANAKDRLYKFTDRSLYGARPAFIKVFAKQEKLDHMSAEELAKHIGLTTSRQEAEGNVTCNCIVYQNEPDCVLHNATCQWRPYFEKCYPTDDYAGSTPGCPEIVLEEEPPETPPPSPPTNPLEMPTPAPSKAPSPPTVPFEPESWYLKNYTVKTKPPSSITPFPTMTQKPTPVPPSSSGETSAWYIQSYDEFTKPPSQPTSTLENDPWYIKRYDQFNPPVSPPTTPLENDPWYVKKYDEFSQPPTPPRTSLENDPWYIKRYDQMGPVSPPVKSLENDPWYMMRYDQTPTTPEHPPTQAPYVNDQWYIKRYDELGPTPPTSVEEINNVTDPWYVKYYPNYGNYTKGKRKKKKKKRTTGELITNDEETKVSSNETKEGSVMEHEPFYVHKNVNAGASRNLGISVEEVTSVTSPIMQKKLDYTEFVSPKSNATLHASSTKVPSKSCPTWGPSIVPRKPLDDSKQHDATELVSNARSFAISRRLPSGNVTDFLPVDEASIKKLNDIRQESQEFGMDISGPIFDSTKEGPLNDAFVSILSYGNRHPFEDGFDSTQFDSTSKSLYEPMRLTFITSELESIQFSNGIPDVRVNAVLKDILPQVAKIWSETLSVIPVSNNLYPIGSSCGESTILSSHKADGIKNSDVAIYVSARGSFCAGNPGYSAACNFDQHMRPIVGNLALCFDEIKVKDGSISQNEVLRHVGYLTHEIGKVLGLTSSMFQHYRNPDNGKPWGTVYQNATCVDGSKSMVHLPNILRKGYTEKDERVFYEISTPTVLQVVRNHFDCQRLTGARLDNYPASRSCFGSHLDERFYFGDDFTPLSNRRKQAFVFSPLSLALLEDSSWYKANFTKATTSSFGHGAGCGFHKGDCVVDGKVPDYSKGFFCSDSPSLSDEPSGCDYSHAFKAACDVTTGVQSPVVLELAFFPNQPDWGSLNADVDFCPMKSKNLVSCSDVTGTASLAGEVYGSNSKCFETDQRHSVCLESYCNKANQRIEIIVQGTIFRCDYDGQILDLGQGYLIECPRLAIACPDLVCPSDCSGKGICDYCQEVPQCICDDPFDVSPGCWGATT